MAEGLTDRGRPIFGPTPPGQGPPCARRSPLTGAEVAEVAALIAAARRGRQATELPERLPSSARAIACKVSHMTKEHARWRLVTNGTAERRDNTFQLNDF